jgi:uncharacterized membrane protein
MKAYLARLTRPDPIVILAAVFAILILHVCTTLAAPRMALSSAYDRLAPALKPNTMVLFPPITPDAQPLPYLAPDVRIAVCLFDTRRGKVALTATLPGPGWSLTLYDPDGIATYTAAGRPERSTEISLLLVPDDDRFMGLSPEARGLRSARRTQLQVQARKGLAVLRAPDSGFAYRARTEADMLRAGCKPAADEPPAS